MIYNLGSVNIDFVYTLAEFVKPGETVACENFAKFAGGKGFNQSTALARAGARVVHIGAVGDDGAWLAETLAKDGADVSHIAVCAGKPTGHAVIQVDKAGQNCIIVEAGANGAVTETMIDAALSGAVPGDIFLAQNETSAIACAMRRAKSRGMRVALNPAPMNESVFSLPLDSVDFLIVNESEGAEIAGMKSGGAESRDMEKVFGKLRGRFPTATIILTLGADGAMAAKPRGEILRLAAHPAKVADSTAAGDCFTGYLLAKIADGASLNDALRTANIAASICVSRHGASVSIPRKNEVA